MNPIYRILCIYFAAFMSMPALNAPAAGNLYYTYGTNGLVASVATDTPNGLSLQYQYDVLGRLTNVIDLRLTGLVKSNTIYTFNAVNKLVGCVYPNGVSYGYAYDARDVLTNESVSLGAIQLARFSYKAEATGNWTNLTEVVNGVNRTYVWNYDALYQLTNETLTASAGPTGQLAYQFDAVGNRTNRTGNLGSLGSVSYSYNVNDWLTSDSYDPNGNTIASGGNTYSYNFDNHLTNVNNGAVTMVYNGDGMRVWKTVGDVTTFYLIDDKNPTGLPQVVEELTISGGTANLSRVYTYGLNLISQRQPGVSTNFFVHDGHRSTRLLTDIAGNIVNAFAYDAYGTLIASNAAPQTAYLYAGEQWDADLGMYYFLARYYKPETGRYWTMDTYSGDPYRPYTLHKYLYCGNNPINKIDPTGNDDLGMTLVSLTIYTGLASLGIAGGVYAYRHLGRPVLQQMGATEINQNDLLAAINQLQRYSFVSPKFNLLADALNDGRLHVEMFDGPGAGQHFGLNNKTIFIANSTLSQGSLATALVMFAEFQHDPQSGDMMDETRAQAEFVQVREAIRKINPSAITPYIQGLQHGNGGF